MDIDNRWENNNHTRDEHNFGDPTWTEYYYIKVLSADTINENLIELLNSSSKKGINTFNLVLFIMEVFDEESKKNYIQ